MKKKNLYFSVDCGKNGIIQIYIGKIEEKDKLKSKLDLLATEYNTKGISETLKHLALKKAKINPKDLKVYKLHENDFLEALESFKTKVPKKFRDKRNHTIKWLINDAYKSVILSKPPMERYLHR